jgi:hypothetical protein
VPTIERSITVRAEREPLFWLMQDYSRRLEWDEFLSEARLVGGASRAGVGVRAWCVDQKGRGMETEYVSFQPPDRVAVKMTRGPWLLASFAGSWIYASADDGGTRVTFKYHIKTRPRWLARLMDPFVIEAFADEMEKRLESMKRHIER